LAYAIKREKDYPSARKLHERLRKIEQTARDLPALTRELIDPRIIALLSNDGVRSEDLLDLARGVRSIADPLNRVAEHIAHMRKRNPPKQGQGKLYPAAPGPSPLEQCALIVAMIWYREKGNWPGLNDKVAHKLCEQFWLEAGGKPHGGLGAKEGELNAWRKYIAEGRKKWADHAAGRLVDHILRGGLAPEPGPPWLTDPGRPTRWYSKEFREEMALLTETRCRLLRAILSRAGRPPAPT
jgi:hypothetical protein